MMLKLAASKITMTGSNSWRHMTRYPTAVIITPVKTMLMRISSGRSWGVKLWSPQARSGQDYWAIENYA